VSPLPADPFADGEIHDDACTAIGTAVLDCLAGGSRFAIAYQVDERYIVDGEDYRNEITVEP
jgi:hypothetical protein